MNRCARHARNEKAQRAGPLPPRFLQPDSHSFIQPAHFEFNRQSARWFPNLWCRRLACRGAAETAVDPSAPAAFAAAGALRLPDAPSQAWNYSSLKTENRNLLRIAVFIRPAF